MSRRQCSSQSSPVFLIKLTSSEVDLMAVNTRKQLLFCVNILQKTLFLFASFPPLSQFYSEKLWH